MRSKAAVVRCPGTDGRADGRAAQPHLHRDWAHRCHICTGTGLTAATSAPGLGFAGLMCVAPKLLSFYKTIPEPKTVPKGMSRVPEVRGRPCGKQRYNEARVASVQHGHVTHGRRARGVGGSQPPPPYTNTSRAVAPLSWLVLPTLGRKAAAACDGCARPMPLCPLASCEWLCCNIKRWRTYRGVLCLKDA